MSNIIDSIQLSGTTYQIQGSGGGGNPTVEVTQAEYDVLVTAGTVSADTYYIITDAQAGDLTNYYTKSETNTLLGGKADTTAVTQSITEATSGKVDSNVYTAYTASTDTALSNKQTTLTAGTNITIVDNVISVTVDSAISSSSTNPVQNAVIYQQFGGLKLQQITQAEFDALSPNYDSNTLYVIVN